MTMMHLKYPANLGFYSWDELGCLSRALGFQADMFKWKISELGVPVDTIAGMSTKEIMKLVDSKCFDLVVDKTLNGHTADWNLCVVRRALTLVERRVLTFEDLHQIRAAYQAYEAQDLKGLELDEKTLLRCLKMCGRVIAPLKMQHRLKHMSQTFDEEGRIQLYEFLDLILWCELYGSFKLPRTEGYQKKKKMDDLFEIPDFQKIVMHNDERLAQYLNDRFLKEEWDFGKETYTKRKLPKEPPVNRDFRLERIKEDKLRSRQLKSAVTNSQRRVYNAQAGYVRPRPISAPAAEEFDKSDKSSVHTAHSQRPVTVHELVRDFIAPTMSFSGPTKSQCRERNTDGHGSLVRDIPHPVVAPAVTRDDLDKTAADIEDLKFQMTTLELKYRQNLLEDMKYFVPGRRPGAPAKADAPVLPPTPSAEEEARAAALARAAEMAAAANRMAYAPYRPPPSPAHGAVCDARFRGWRGVRTKPGKHYVLTTVSYDGSPTGNLLSKLNRRAHDEVRNVKGDYVARYTRRDQAAKPDTLRPATAPPSTASSSGYTRRSDESAGRAGTRTARAAAIGRSAASGGSGSSGKRAPTSAETAAPANEEEQQASSRGKGATVAESARIRPRGLVERASRGVDGGVGVAAAASAADAARALSQYAKSLLAADPSKARESAAVAELRPHHADVVAGLRAASGRSGHEASASGRRSAGSTAAVARVSFVDSGSEADDADATKPRIRHAGAPSEPRGTPAEADDDEDDGEAEYSWQDFNIYRAADDSEGEETHVSEKRQPKTTASGAVGLCIERGRGAAAPRPATRKPAQRKRLSGGGGGPAAAAVGGPGADDSAPFARAPAVRSTKQRLVAAA